MKHKTGRPMRYLHIIRALHDDRLYSPATIASLARDTGLLDPTVEPFLARQRVRIAMARYATSHGFPHEGDGLVTIPGQTPTPGWFGRAAQAGAGKPRASGEGE